jgi:hypothetical protein
MRRDLFRYVADAGRPVDVAELTAHLGLHHTPCASTSPSSSRRDRERVDGLVRRAPRRARCRLRCHAEDG